MTSNDYALDVYNGETGVVVRQGLRRRAFVAGSDRLRDFAPGRLDAVETMHAMTIHKSQGSQADRVTVLLPDEGSRLLTRELFYTAVTRAQEHVRVVGTEAAVRAAVTRRPSAPPASPSGCGTEPRFVCGPAGPRSVATSDESSSAARTLGDRRGQRRPGDRAAPAPTP